MVTRQWAIATPTQPVPDEADAFASRADATQAVWPAGGEWVVTRTVTEWVSVDE